MIEFFLAGLVMSQILETAPTIVAPFRTEKECVAEMDRLNALPEMQSADAKRVGAAFVCLKIQRGPAS